MLPALLPIAESGVPCSAGARVIKDGMPDHLRKQRAGASILGIEGTGWDIGNAVRFLLSNHARYISGHTLVVDGGLTLRAPERESAEHS